MYPAVPLNILLLVLAVCLGNSRRSRCMVLQRALSRMSEVKALQNERQETPTRLCELLASNIGLGGNDEFIPETTQRICCIKRGSVLLCIGIRREYRFGWLGAVG